MAWLIDKKPTDAIRALLVTQKASTPAARPIGIWEQKLSSAVGPHYLYQPGELECGHPCATDPVCSLEVYWLGGLVTKPVDCALPFTAWATMGVCPRGTNGDDP